MTAKGTNLHPRSIWSPHRDSGCVQVCKSLLAMRGEDWQWVNNPQEARWIVIDASRQVEDSVRLLLADTQHRRHGIALAKSWTEVPSADWAFFKLPLTPKGFFPWVNQTLGLPANSHVDKELPPDPATQPNQPMSWQGQSLRLRRWPNLTVYPGLSLQVVQVCRRMLTEDVPYEEMLQVVGNEDMLRRLLADAWLQDNLRALKPTEALSLAAATQATSATGSAGPTREQRPTSAPQAEARRGLFQRFLSRFR